MNDLNFIICPDCKIQIPVTEALSHQLEEKYKEEFNSKFKEIEEDRRKLDEEQRKLRENFEEEKRKLEELNSKQQESFEKKLKLSLEEKESELKEKSRQYLIEQREKLKEEAVMQAKELASLEMEDLKKQNLEAQERLQQSREQELKLREEKRALEQKEKEMELQMARKLDEEMSKMSEKIREEQTDKLRMQQMEYEKKLGDMQKALEDAQRKGLASSERFRGEVQELDLEDALRSNFMFDKITEVPKGINGADVIQEVFDNMGRSCGMIVWECKRTKSFNEEWVKKLKDDVIRTKGNIAIIVSQSLPEEITSFAWKDGVWVCNFSSYIELASVIRLNLMELKRVEKLNEGKGEKMAQVYNYLSSDEFRYKIQSIAETFITIREQLEQEKRAYTKHWSSREMQIKRLTEGTVSIVGDLQGLMGNSMPAIEGMEFPGLGI